MSSEGSGGDLVNLGTNLFSLGTLGYDKENQSFGTGKGFNSNLLGRPAVEGLKEVTGAKAAEDALEESKARFQEEKDEALRQREQAQADFGRNQLSKSRIAGGARLAASRENRRTSTPGSNLGSDERDFLGL